MRRSSIIRSATAALIAIPSMASAQSTTHPILHVDPRWKECAFQLDATLTQGAWRQFTREAGVVAYFRPMTDARPLGAGNWELSMAQTRTGIDDLDAAWNDTFVHPDSAHYLFEGESLPFPGLTARRGITDRIDVGLTFAKNPESNYGFYGAQVQYAFPTVMASAWDAAARASFVSMFGPEDLDLTVFGADVLASRTFANRWGALSPYAGVGAQLSVSHEKTAAVALDDEQVLSAQAMLGVAAQASVVRLGLEYSAASVRSLAFRVGFAF